MVLAHILCSQRWFSKGERSADITYNIESNRKGLKVSQKSTPFSIFIPHVSPMSPCQITNWRRMRFEAKYQELVDEGDGFEEDIDEYTSEGIFFVPAGARWSEIAAKAHTPEIGVAIDDAMRAIEKEKKLIFRIR